MTDTTYNPALPYPGLFIAFDGNEYSGKSTQISRLSTRLRADGHDVITTREPGGTAFGEAIRGLLGTHATEIDPDTQLLLHFASRKEHLSQVILPALQAGKIVLCDRYMDSSFVYQCVLAGANERLFFTLATYVCRDLAPDHTYIFDVSVDVIKERRDIRGAGDHYDRLSDDELEKIRTMYQNLATVPQHSLVDGTLSPDAITDQLVVLIGNDLNDRRALLDQYQSMVTQNAKDAETFGDNTDEESA